MIRSTASAAAVAAVLLIGGTANATASTHLPKAVPTPPGAKVLSVKKSSGERVYRLKVRNEKSAYSFWRKALPKDGFTVNKSKSINGYGFGQIFFSGKGYNKDGTMITLHHRLVTIDLETGGSIGL